MIHRLLEFPICEGMELMWEHLFFMFRFDASEDLFARDSLDLS
jgi:hypothetical protein